MPKVTWRLSASPTSVGISAGRSGPYPAQYADLSSPLAIPHHKSEAGHVVTQLVHDRPALAE